VKNANGKYGVMILDSVTVTVITQAFTINYSYIPNSSVLVERTRKYASDTELIAKIVTDADANGKVNTYTLESCIFKGQYKIDIVDLAIAQDLE
jgi:5-hydroxyisourate hydrolase-like protein (transthyretin family)